MRRMGKSLVTTYATFAFNLTLLEQFATQHIDQAEQVKDVVGPAIIALNKGFTAWRGVLSKREMNKIRRIEREMAKRTFLSEEIDIVAAISFGIGILEHLMVYITDEDRRKIIDECIHAMLAVQQEFDPELNENEYYKMADEAVETFHNIVQEIF